MKPNKDEKEFMEIFGKSVFIEHLTEFQQKELYGCYMKQQQKLKAKDDEMKDLDELYNIYIAQNVRLAIQNKDLKKKNEDLRKGIQKAEDKRITDNNDYISIPIKYWLELKKQLEKKC